MSQKVKYYESGFLWSLTIGGHELLSFGWLGFGLFFPVLQVTCEKSRFPGFPSINNSSILYEKEEKKKNSTSPSVPIYKNKVFTNTCLGFSLNCWKEHSRKQTEPGRGKRVQAPSVWVSGLSNSEDVGYFSWEWMNSSEDRNLERGFLGLHLVTFKVLFI